MSNLSSLFFSVAIFSAILLALHFSILWMIPEPAYGYILMGHIFFFVATFLILWIFSRSAELMIEKAGFVFMGLEFLKGGALVILLLLFEARGKLDNIMLLNVMGIYLMHLFFSMFMGVKTLNKANKIITGK